ncbi:SEC-C domain-containing protein [Streptomyces sp. NPDC046915]|uniref:YecA family protein n=1 Tax=Streptomyces sp. NPDC046915 TaxID=3155257 RepID=UPI0033FC10AC
MMHAPQSAVGLPRRMRHLEVDHRGYPVIATVDRSTEGVDFGAVSERRKLVLAAFDWCAVCGMPFADEPRRQSVYDNGPLPSALTSGEAPVHEVCALYAAQVCPYLFSPRSRLGDDMRKGTVRDPVMRFAGFRSTSAVTARESQLQPGVHTLHFEHRGQADEFSYRSPEEIRDRFADVLAREKDLPVSDPEGALIRPFSRLDEGGEVTGAALVAGAAFAKDVFAMPGLEPFRGKHHLTVAGLMLKGTEEEIREFSDGSQDEAFGAVGPWVLERTGQFPLALQRWRARGQGMVRRPAPPPPPGPGRTVAKNAPCPCGSGRKARRCHPSGLAG